MTKVQGKRAARSGKTKGGKRRKETTSPGRPASPPAARPGPARPAASVQGEPGERTVERTEVRRPAAALTAARQGAAAPSVSRSRPCRGACSRRRTNRPLAGAPRFCRGGRGLGDDGGRWKLYAAGPSTGRAQGHCRAPRVHFRDIRRHSPSRRGCVTGRSPRQTRGPGAVAPRAPVATCSGRLSEPCSSNRRSRAQNRRMGSRSTADVEAAKSCSGASYRDRPQVLRVLRALPRRATIRGPCRHPGCAGSGWWPTTRASNKPACFPEPSRPAQPGKRACQRDSGGAFARCIGFVRGHGPVRGLPDYSESEDRSPANASADVLASVAGDRAPDSDEGQ